MKASAFFVVILLITALSAGAGEPAAWPEWRAPLLAKYGEELKTLNASLTRTPDSIPLLSERGDCHLFLGHFPEAVADFEKTITIDPAEDAPHWRLGIAYYFAGQYAKSARQFEKYHAYDGHDRENGIWKFLAQAKAEGLEKARAGMLVYTKFDREPFPSLYKMFAGEETADELLAEVERKGLGTTTTVVFFANYYAGLNEALLGRKARGLELLEKAVSLPQARERGGPGYMWQVARLHWERLRGELGATAAPER